MAKKITLSIPDNLYTRMSTWRDTFNLSRMFQDVLADAIQKKEDFQKRLSEDINMPEVISRLKKEKMESMNKLLDTGKNEGLRWAQIAHYEELTYALHWEPEQDVFKNKMLGNYFSELFNKDDYAFLINKDFKNAARGYTNVFLRGWKMGVDGFWQMVKDKI